MLEDIDVAHITFSRSGGAGVVAARLHAALNSGGVSSGLYFQSAKSLREAPLESPALTILAALDDWVVRARDNYLGQISLARNLYSAGWTDAISSKVIVLHWVEGVVSERQLRRWAEEGRKVYWYLHDNRPLTGACHTGHCPKFTDGCKQCPAVRRPMQTLVTLARNRVELCKDIGITFLAPSDRLYQWSSALNLRVERVMNPVSEIFFQSKSDGKLCQLPKKGSTLSFSCVARNLNDLNKGVTAACEFFDSIASLPIVGRLDLFGEGEIQGRNCLGTKTEIEMAGILKEQVDILLFFSEFENAPLVVLEAAAAGVLVVCPDKTLSNMDDSFREFCLSTSYFAEIIGRSDSDEILNRQIEVSQSLAMRHKASHVAQKFTELAELNV